MGNLVADHFSVMEDPRGRTGRTHKLIDIISIFILAVLGGSDDMVEVEAYGWSKEEKLREFLDLSAGIPSHDTFCRVLAMLDPDAFERCFRTFIAALASRQSGGLLSLDGKVMRRSYEQAWKANPAHMVSLYAHDLGLVLGQVKVDEKSNEITAIPELLDLVDIAGAVVRIDAMGTQRKIAEKIVEKKGHYVLPLKKNQPKARAKVRALLDEARLCRFEGMNHDYCEETVGGHGRIDTRKVWVTNEVHHLKNFQLFAGMASVALVENTSRKIGGKTTVEKHYFISDLENPTAKEMAGYVRGHWGIENGLHWRLDMCFDEDSSRVRKGHAAENFSRVRRVAFNLLQADQDDKSSMKVKRKRAGWNDEYLSKLIRM